ncbi:MAG: mechanosensitive ion channel protein [Bdellovibrio sp. CG10_big_fil_rev_8_21_14_0_10_47_8]|nr:MAG: mechanosensitive ion channel protein [Bdellovibrio sp. CG10_big_fil_rev_8_21_14_0_10_47_8]
MNSMDVSGAADVFDVLSFTKITLLIFGLVCLGIAAKFVSSIGLRLNRRIPSRRLLIAQIVTMVSFFIYIFGGGYVFYGVVQPPKTLLLAASGTLAVALGLSLKDLVASIVAGVILLFDRPFQVGDRVTFDKVYGEVKTIGLRAVRLVTLDDSIVTIPNSRFITDVVSSGNSGSLDMMIEINFHLALEADLRRAQDILYETAATSRFVFLKKPITIVFTEVEFAGRQAMQVRVKCYVIDVRFEKALQTDILVRGNEALIAHGIQRPALLRKDRSDQLRVQISEMKEI